MQKKSTSQSAFVNLRVVVGLSIFLLGVFLALFGVANPSGPKPSICGDNWRQPRRPRWQILFDQFTGFTLGHVPSQRFVPPGAIDAESAEDFEVFDAQGWTIGEFKFEIGLVGSEPAMVDIRVYPDANGQPGEPALCSYDGVARHLARL